VLPAESVDGDLAVLVAVPSSRASVAVRCHGPLPDADEAWTFTVTVTVAELGCGLAVAQRAGAGVAGQQLLLTSDPLQLTAAASAEVAVRGEE